MTPESVRQTVLGALAAIAPEADVAAVDPDRPLREQLDLDSYDFLNLMVELAERLDVEVPERDYGKVTTLARLVDYLVARSAGGAAS